MKRYKKMRPRGSDSTEESLRGKNRELLKTIKQLQQRIRQLEKQLGLGATSKETVEKKVTAVQLRPVICEVCGKGEMEEYTFEGPGRVLRFLMCKLCKHRQKIK